MPEMAAVSAGDKCVGAISWRDMYTASGSAPRHNGCARPMPSREASGGNVSAATAKVSAASTTEVPTASTTEMPTAATTTAAAMFREGIGGKR